MSKRRLGREDIAAITPALFEDLKPLWMMMETCQRFNIPIHPYGLGETYAGWVKIKVHMIIEVCDVLMSAGKSHVIYTDGRDAFYLSPIEEILEKYQDFYGAPELLQSTEAGIFESYASYYDLSLYPTSESKGHPYVWPGSCAFIGEVQFIQYQLQWMVNQWSKEDPQMPDDDPAWWRRWDHEHAWELRDGNVKFDWDCQIFQNCGNQINGQSQFEEALKVDERDGGGRRVYNRLTGSWPCVLHFNGGASDALKGKYRDGEDIKKIWLELGYEDNPPWTEEESRAEGAAI